MSAGGLVPGCYASSRARSPRHRVAYIAGACQSSGRSSACQCAGGVQFAHDPTHRCDRVLSMSTIWFQVARMETAYSSG